MSDWQNITLTTIDIKDDYEILDIVNVTVAGNTWKDEAKALGLDIETGWMSYGDVSTVFTVASSTLKFQAEQIGADAVVGCEFDVGFDSEGPYVTGFGTAVKIK
tara:strand:- start:3262 stop:3573 length:312 start_codon:yes stop_codon:yes gene_type:complete